MEFRTITVSIQRITSKQQMKYMGVGFDNRLTFREHFTYIGEKWVATSCALARIIPNVGGSKQERRRLLMKVVTLIAIYAVPIWAGAMDKRTDSAGIKAAYRRSALRVISAFRTVPADATLVIAGMMLLRLGVDVEKRKRDTKRGIDFSLRI